MKLFLFGIFGLLLQGVGLTAFMVVSRSSGAAWGKAAVIVVTGFAVCTLLWEGVRRSKGILVVCLLPVTLALGYDVAFHALGLLGFPGLLRDAKELSLDYLISVLQVTGTLLIFYGLAAGLFFAISRGFRRTRTHTNQQSPKLS
jgi:hypothetical protein